MIRIIDQPTHTRQYVTSSEPIELVDYPNSQKNVQACEISTSSALRCDLRDLENSLNPRLSKLEREYWSWNFRNPGARLEDVPRRYIPVFDSWEREDLGERFRVKVKSDAVKDQLKDVERAFERDKPGMNRRRADELKMAERFRGDVAVLGPMEFKRGDQTVSIHPVDVADRLSSCRQTGHVGLKPGGGYVVAYDQKCGYSKLCPDESRAESMRIAKRYIPASEVFLSEKKSHRLYFVIPTMPNSPIGDLVKGKKEIFGKFNKLRARKCFGVIKGGLSIQEDPLSEHLDWNIHLNCLLLADGYLDFKAVRDAWGFNIQFYSEAQMIAKTKAKLKKRGFDVSAMTRLDLLAHTFMELSKYAAAPLVSKSKSKSASGESDSPPMTEWPAEEIREWFMGNMWFRRTRSFGVLYDPEGYRWGLSEESIRRGWLDAAGLNGDLSTLNWRKEKESLTKEHRHSLRKVMTEKEVFDISLVEWIGPIKYEISKGGYQTPFDLIPEDKLGFEPCEVWNASPEFPTGPPPDAPEGGDLMASWEEYCIEAEI